MPEVNEFLKVWFLFCIGFTWNIYMFQKEHGGYSLRNEWMSRWCWLDLLLFLRMDFIHFLSSLFLWSCSPQSNKKIGTFIHMMVLQRSVLIHVLLNCKSKTISEHIPNWLVAWVLKIWSCQTQWIICIYKHSAHSECRKSTDYHLWL